MKKKKTEKLLTEIRWGKFKKDPIGSFRNSGVDKLKVIYGKSGAYFNAYMHWVWHDDMGYSKKDDYIVGKYSKKKYYFCEICKGLKVVKFVVPYDGSRPPGRYCYNCRKKYSIMDIENAKRFNKVL